MASKLRAVDPGETPPPAAPKSVSEAVEGSSRDVLVAIRRTLAEMIDKREVSSNAVASASKELRELDRLIRAEDAAAAAEGKMEDRAQRGRRSFNAAAI